ncbi:MAG: methyltransferase domain-containing protein [Planctomycetota bacterium]|jgi:SAM-dependent methyltransferase
MRNDLIDRIELVCPACSWTGGDPAPLKLTAEKEVDGDVISGHFSCPGCPRRFPILEGVAVLDPEPLRTTYDRPDFLQAYLWTHFADLSPDLVEEAGAPAGDYFPRLREQPAEGLVLDLGCNVGRTSFDLAERADFVLGVERSFEAVKRAREIVRTRRVSFHLKDEGDRGRYVDLDASSVVRTNLEFVCGDAIALPLATEVADTIVAANLIDRVREPAFFLSRADQVLRPGGRLVLTAPFTWREESTPRKRWLGDEKRTGREVLLDWCAEQGYEVEEESELSLTIRNHRRFFELVRPLLVRARKGE